VSYGPRSTVFHIGEVSGPNLGPAVVESFVVFHGLFRQMLG
jgi:hypothetical protein